MFSRQVEVLRGQVGGGEGGGVHIFQRGSVGEGVSVEGTGVGYGKGDSERYSVDR